MTKTKEILRKCAGCSAIKNREELIKITADNSSHDIFINPNSKIFGRSVYLCYNKMCVEHSLKKNKLGRALKATIPDYLIKELQETTFHKG